MHKNKGDLPLFLPSASLVGTGDGAAQWLWSSDWALDMGMKRINMQKAEGIYMEYA